MAFTNSVLSIASKVTVTVFDKAPLHFLHPPALLQELYPLSKFLNWSGRRHEAAFPAWITSPWSRGCWEHALSKNSVLSLFLHVCISLCHNKNMCYFMDPSLAQKQYILLPLLAVCFTNDAHMLWMSLMSHYHEGFQALLLQFKAFRSRFNIVSGCLFIWWQVTHHRPEKALMLVKSANQLMASDSAFRK